MSPRRNRTAIATMLTIAALAFSAGCGDDGGTAPPLGRSAPEAADFILPLDGAGNPAAMGAGGLQSWLLQTTRVVDGARGGVIQLGRFKLTFAPGAFSGVLPISVLDATQPWVKCELYPEGLQFSAPVTLEVDLRCTTGDNSLTTIFWYNPETKSWVDVHGVYDPNGHCVRARLEHFSTYCPGRGGW